MDVQNANSICELIETDSPLQRASAISLDVHSTSDSIRHTPASKNRAKVLPYPNSESGFCFTPGLRAAQDAADAPSPTIAEFVKQRFIPEFVMTKGFAGRTHFRAILKHVLPPELVAIAFGRNPNIERDKLTTVLGWPYLDQFHLCEISPDAIQQLTSCALAQGYSVQTAIHIRNVVRSIFSHAIRTGLYSGKNPAAEVVMPAPRSENRHILTLLQLADLMTAMGYPEKEMALFALLTGMNMGEICGLRWKYLNLSNTSRIFGPEVIPPRTIAVRNQSHRGRLSAVAESRKRFIRVPKGLELYLADLRRRKEHTGPHDLVLVSRIGTAVHAENVAARRLKLIGRSLEIPWLTWSVFYRTRLHFAKQLGPKMNLEFEKILQLE